MPLATLADVKRKLNVSDSDTSLDAAIQAVLDAADRYLLNATGYALNAASEQEVHRNVPRDGVLYTRKRPVASISLIEAKTLGDTAWVSIAYELLDAARGIVALVPAALAWPHLQAVPVWARWRLGVWPLVRVSYTTATASGIEDLEDACAELAAYWYRQHRANVVSVSLAGISESYPDWPVPPWVEVVVRRHRCWQARVV